MLRIGIIVVCLTLSPLDANPFESTMLEPTSFPPKTEMTFLGFFGFVLGGQPGSIAVYDNRATKRVGDYSEIYNAAGDLVAVVWYDNFGILRSAVDRGVILNKPLEGVFVLVLDGELT
jgi:hypothetical protein